MLDVLVGTANGTVLFGSARAALGANLFDLRLTLVMLLALLQLSRPCGALAADSDCILASVSWQGA